MARARIIKPGFFKNEELSELTPLARLLWAGIWTIADRDGRLEDRPRKIKAELLPYDECDGEALIAALAGAGFLLRYEVDDQRFLQVMNWKNHQQPHVKEQASAIPAPDMHGASTVQAPDMPESSTEDAHLDTRYQIPERETPPTPSPGEAADKPPRAVRSRGIRIPPDFAMTPRLYAYAAEKEVTAAEAESVMEGFKLYWESASGQNAIKSDWNKAWMNRVLDLLEAGKIGPTRRIGSTTPNGYRSQAEINRPGQRNPDGSLRPVL
jgi:hypothetical protein